MLTHWHTSIGIQPRAPRLHPPAEIAWPGRHFDAERPSEQFHEFLFGLNCVLLLHARAIGRLADCDVDVV